MNLTYWQPMSQFGKNLVKILDQRGHSQNWLARKTGILQSLISKYALGKSEPGVTNALKIAEALRVPITDLLGIPGDLTAARLAAAIEKLPADKRAAVMTLLELNEEKGKKEEDS